MNKYYIDYLVGEDLCHIWVYATSKSDAERVAKREYWDIDHIIGIRKA